MMRFSCRRARCADRPLVSRVLQRKCACGGHSKSGSGCEECRKRRLQKKGDSQDPSWALPMSVEEVVQAGGAQLDPPTRMAMEAGFGHDFGSVRVHADARAAASAQDVGALAYTVGNHVVFGGGSRPWDSSDRQRLLAHELAHVVQQSRGPLDATRDDRGLEQEADAAADAVSSGRRATVGTSGLPGVHRKPKAGAKPAPEPKPPSKSQQAVIDRARAAAAIRCQIAMHRVAGMVPPEPDPAVDPAAAMQMRSSRLARRMFEWENPNMEQVGQIVGSMVTHLMPGLEVLVAAKDDPECGNRGAYVRGLRPPVILCGAFFSNSAEGQIRTMIHESAHLARIGDAGVGESYCIEFDCASTCGGFDSADSWAHFVHCLSDQKPDEPEVFKPRKSKGKKPPAGRSGEKK
jgi:hypothetical protein